MKREVSQKFKTREHSAEEAKFTGINVLWNIQPNEEKTSAVYPSLYPNHSETRDSAGRGNQIGFPRALIGLMPVGSSFSTASAYIWRAKT